MALVKVRRVGNSNVITLPAGLGGSGFEPGAAVLVEADEDGTLRVIPVPDLDAHVREVARTAIQRRRRTLEILEAHDREGAESPHALT
jgi:antitoxin component of MazEF toxin-antitoxin module